MQIFKMHFGEDSEFFEYDAFGSQGAAATQKEQPYLESLLSFLELDLAAMEPQMRLICKNWGQFFSTGDAAFADHALQELGILGAQHIYFQLPYLRCFAHRVTGNLNPKMTKELRQLPEQLSLYQKQAQIFLENVLDIDRVGRDTQKNARQNYSLDGPCDPETFSFQPVRVSFEPVRADACGAVLYPDTIRDIIDFSLRDCVARGIPVRRCRSCGRYFPLTGRVTAEYCSRPNPSGKLCRNTGAVQKWAENRRGDLVFKEYRREYKRRFAWIRAGKISEDDFSVWSKKAREKKADCDKEKITLEEFKTWLRNP